MKTIACLGAVMALAACAGPQPGTDSGRGWLALSANDNKAVLENGAVRVVPNAAPDTLALIDLRTSPPRLVAEINVPTSVVGPPLGVAIAPDESYALVSAAMRLDGAKQVPNNKVSVVDLVARPPRVIATHDAGAGVAGISINRKGTLALAANRAEGTVSVFAINGRNLTHVGKVKLGDAKSGPSHAAITPDGTMALVTRDGDNRISVLSISGTSVVHTKRDIFAGQRPYGIDICMPGDIAVVANIGVGQGDADTISVIDLKAQPPRVIETITVGQTPEGIICSPDGGRVAVVAMSGSNKAPASPFYRANGRVIVFDVDGKRLSLFGEADIGRWSQGAVFSPDGRKLLVQNMVEKNIHVFEFGIRGLHDTGHRIALKGGGASLRSADRAVD